MNPNGFLVVSGWYTAALSFSPPQKHSTNITNRKISLKNLPKKLNMQKNIFFVFFWGPFSNFKMFFFFLRYQPKKTQNFEKQKKTNQDVLIKTWVGVPPFAPFSPLGFSTKKNPWPPSYEVTTRLSQSCLSSWIEILFFLLADVFFFFRNQKKNGKKEFLKGCVVFFLKLGWYFFLPSFGIDLVSRNDFGNQSSDDNFWWVFSQPSRWILDGFSRNYWCLVSVPHPGCHRGKWRFIRIAD